MIREQSLCCILADSKCIYKLENSSLFIDLVVFVTTFFDDFPDFIGSLEDSYQITICLCFKINLWHLFFYICEPERYILINSHIRPKSIVLEQESNFSFICRNVYAHAAVKDDLISDSYLSACRSLKTSNHSKCSGLTTTRWSKKSNKCIISDCHGKIIYCIELSPTLINMFKFYFWHN